MRLSGSFPLCLAIAACFLSGCAARPGQDSAMPTATAYPTVTAYSTATSAPLTPTFSATPKPQPSPTTPPSATPTLGFTMCSPLEDISLADLNNADLLKNPFQQPRPGLDDGHHGADFAYWSRGTHTTMLGLPVHALLAGRVASVIHNRQPYGYAVIIETRLDRLPTQVLEKISLPSPAPTVPPSASLNCPPDPTDYAAHTGQSLYLLYAHFQKDPPVAEGDQIACGAVIGAVGTSGKSVNAHLHLETRLGPAGVQLPEMDYYDTAATPQQMRTYCTWRVSGLFAMFDPLRLIQAGLSLQP